MQLNTTFTATLAALLVFTSTVCVCDSANAHNLSSGQPAHTHAIGADLLDLLEECEPVDCINNDVTAVALLTSQGGNSAAPRQLDDHDDLWPGMELYQEIATRAARHLTRALPTLQWRETVPDTPVKLLDLLLE